MAVGKTPQRIDAVDKVTGAATYPADRVPDNALHAVVVFTNQPHARLVDLDFTDTLTAPGVVTVVTAADVPVNEYGLTLFDQPVFIGLDDTGRSSVPCDVSRWEADHLAVVVAENLLQAREASALIKAQWEILPLVSDVSTARSDEVLVHPNSTSNTYHELRIRKGDSAQGMELADVVIEDTYELPHQEHAYLQVEAATAWLDDNKRVTVETSGQWVHEDRDQIAHALDVDPEEVRVRYASIGGAFGGKEDMSLQIVMAVTIKKLDQLGVRRPVHCNWTREESIVGHHKRHRATVHARLGATADGIITAVEAEVLLDAGAYNYTSNKVLGNLHLSVAGAYDVPNAHIDSKAIYTHSVPGGAFRGFGGPQGAFVAESQMNKMAHALGLDPLELRSRNALNDLSDGITQSGLPEGVGVNRVIEACAEKAPADAALPQTPPFRSIASLPAEMGQLKQGRGYAVGMKNVGFSFGFPEACEADVVFHGDPDTDRPTRVELFHSAAEVGQGVHTALVQMVADAADISISNIDAIYSDTATGGDSGSASASRLTFMAGNSVLGAVEEAEKAWADGARPAVGHFRYKPPATEALDPETGVGQPNFCYGYMAQAVDLTVDVATGHIRVDRVLSIHDVGKVIHPHMLRGQIEGAIAQAHGYTLSEQLVVEEGRIRNPRLSQYLIPGIGDVPVKVECLILEAADPLGPWGARGVSEMPYITYAPAVTAALHDATGVWMNTFPLTPSVVLEHLSAASG
ncbi:MAG: xanthine dehydrogenase family protein molybdopterin-binding subunit [Candidatus Poriferisodalaceae bacterium]